MTENALDCPIESCPGSEISWAAVEGQNLVAFNAGTCYSCGTIAGECVLCEEVTGGLAEGNVKCNGCVARYSLNVKPGDEPSPADVTWWIPESAR